VRYNYPGLPEAVVVVDIGEKASNLVFVDGDRTFFRPLPVAESMPERMIQEVSRSITFYRNQQQGRAPGRVLLAGAVGDHPELERHLAEQLNLPVELFNPLQKIKLGAKVEAASLAHTMYRFGVLAGLAVRGVVPRAVEINLVPEALKKERRFRRKQPLMAACVVVAALIAGTWAFGLTRLTWLVSQESAAVGARIDALERIESRLVPLEERRDELEHRGKAYREIIGRRTLWVETLLELREQLPRGMFLLETEPIRKADVLTGIRISVVSYLDRETRGQDAVILLRDSLRACPRFSDQTKVVTRPTKKLFARNFVIDVFFTEPVKP
jgi:hypothetical protein